ncbi:cytochrome b [Rhabdaerophilum sp. SD176]|uniref:cytochrome b n=1 Tax=Rhabdaerophilum sp. SD176 TaxID=2983548 RepID=UPI0024DFD0E0|nr:cytochrome b [Rhabdaerophilum sp. SD176]
MSKASSRPISYSGGQKLLHWVIALMLLTLIPVGIYMVQRGAATNFDAVTNQLYTAHKTFGFLALLLIVLRIAVRIRKGAPAPEPGLARIQVIAAESTHGLLYLLMVLVPVLGWLGVSAYGATGLLGGFSLPSLLGKDTVLGETILKYHGYAAIAMAGFIAMHVGAALFHRLVLKDGVLRRMLP